MIQLVEILVSHLSAPNDVQGRSPTTRYFGTCQESSAHSLSHCSCHNGRRYEGGPEALSPAPPLLGQESEDLASDLL